MNEQNKQTTCWFSQNNNFFEIKKSIFSQSKTKKNEISIALFHEYFIIFNFENIWHDSIDKSINDKTFLTMFANRKWTRKCRKKKRIETNRKEKKIKKIENYREIENWRETFSRTCVNLNVSNSIDFETNEIVAWNMT